MALKLSQEQKDKIQEKLDSGEWDLKTPELKQITLNVHHEDPLSFARAFLQEHVHDQSPRFHHHLVKLYLNHDRVAVAAPRGHAKSTVTSFIYVLHEALYGRKKNIVIISASEDMAKKFLRRVRDEIEHNSSFKWLFGDQKTDKWSETEIHLKNGTAIHAKGRGAQLRGLIHGAQRPDLIIMDDIEDEELVRSPSRRADLEAWLNGAVVPSLDPKRGQIIFIGTILHMDSLLNRVLDPELYPEYTQKRFAATLESGRPLWPGRFDQETLDSIKDSYSSRGQLAQYFMEYMNDPIPQEDATFKQEYITYFDPQTKPHKKSENITEVFVDLGGGSVKRGADPTAMIVMTISPTNEIFVIDYVNDKMGTDTKRIADELFRLNKVYKPRRFTIEKTMATNMLEASLREECKKRGTFLNIDYVTPTRGSSDRRGNMSDGKYQRIAAMEGAFKMQTIKILPWMKELKEQLFMFPRAKHDDLIDALAYGYMYLTRRSKPQPKKKESEAIFPFEEGYQDTAEEYQPLYKGIGL